MCGNKTRALLRLERCYKKKHKRGRSIEIISTIPKNVVIENSVHQPQIGKSPKKTCSTYIMLDQRK